MTPRVSLIVPTGDRAVLLRRCLDQAAAQTMRLFEVVVVDGGERSSLRVFDEFEGHRWRYVRVSPSTTVGERRNIAIEQASGELIAHFDDDDFYHPYYLRELMAWRDASAPFALGGFSRFWHYDFLRKRGWKTNLWDSGHPYGATFLYPKSTWKDVGGFRSLQKGEDQEFFLAVEKSGRTIASAARPDLFVYMRHTMNVTGAIDPVFHDGWTKAARDVLGPAVDFYDDLAELIRVREPAADGVQFHLPPNLRTFPGQ